jgi:hypothetical protein
VALCVWVLGVVVASVLWGTSAADAQEEPTGPIVISAVVDGPVVEGEPVAVTYLVAGTEPLQEVEPSSSVCGNLGRTPDAGDADPDGSPGVLDVGEVWVFACVADFSGSRDFVSVIAEDLDGNVLGPEFVTLELTPAEETPESTTTTTGDDSQTTTTSAEGDSEDPTSTTESDDDGGTEGAGDSSGGDDSSTTAIAIAVAAVALLCLLLLVVWLMRRKKLLPAPEERLYID